MCILLLMRAFNTVDDQTSSTLQLLPTLPPKYYYTQISIWILLKTLFKIILYKYFLKWYYTTSIRIYIYITYIVMYAYLYCSSLTPLSSIRTFCWLRLFYNNYNYNNNLLIIINKYINRVFFIYILYLN